MSKNFENSIKTFFSKSSDFISKAYHSSKSWTIQKLLSFSKWMYTKLAQSQLRELDRQANQEIQNLKDYIAELESRPTPHQLGRRTQNSLLRKQKEQEEKQKQVEIAQQKLGLSFQQLSVDRQTVYNEQKEVAFEIDKKLQLVQSKINGLRLFKREISLDKRDYNMNVREKSFHVGVAKKELDIYRREVKAVETAMRKDYDLKMKELTLKEREGKANIKEEKNAVTAMYNSNKDTLSQVQLVSKSNRIDGRELSLDKKEVQLSIKELDQRKALISMLEKNLSGSYNLPAIQAYNEHGYKLSNPIDDRVRYLENRIEDLEMGS